MALRSDRQEASIEETPDIDLSDGPFWDEVIVRLDADRVLVELERLPDIYQLAIQLIDVEQLTYEEAAQALEVPIGTVRSRLFRGREMLRNRLQSSFGALERVQL